MLLAMMLAAGGVLRLSIDAANGWFTIDLIGLSPRTLQWPGSAIVWELRLISVCAACAIGAALGVSGLMLQSMLRNPLASPYIIGVSSGAGLAIAGVAWFGFVTTGAASTSGVPVVAPVLGALGTLALVYWLSRRRGAIDPTALVLTGIIVSLTFGAITTLFQSLMPDRGMASVTRWVMGTIRSDTSWVGISMLAGLAMFGTGCAVLLGPRMDAMMLSDDEARSVGVRVGAVRTAMLGLAGVLTAGAVILAGPIGFVGLVAPHMARLLVGHSHRSLVIATALSGSALLVWAEAVVAELRFSTGQIPVGVVTALIGGPIFIVLFRRSDMA
ncbi:MAG: iron ABC transporter permease [Phycisphaeraceae bacterium]|nr:iron ABC transporter permease [Phycisphaerales bacterium]MCB9843521.1 iron ABC transporter permease [Phycisphaeraceae bacterium]